MNKEICIDRKAENPGPSDYQKLREAALETVQQLSGNLWTDYNDHDPGVTIMDAFNYALTELHYKLSFPPEEYLTGAGSNFRPNDFGLFLPGQVYPTAPVTTGDYRKLFFDRISEIADIWLRPSPHNLPGTLDIIVDLSPSSKASQRTETEDKIRKLYNENRNLGEKLGKVLFREKQELEFWAEIHLTDDANAAEILARIYFACACYFNSGIKYHNLRRLLEKEDDWSVLLDGPLTKNGIIDDDSVLPARKTFYVSELYSLIKEIKGIQVIENISLKSDSRIFTDEITCEDILHSYTVNLPARKQDIQLLLLKNEKEVTFVFSEVQKYFKKLVVEEYGRQNQFAGFSEMQLLPQGKYIDFSGYDSIQNDFPNFYGINDKGIPSYYSEERKARAKQLKGYLLLFDFILAGSMQEINQLRDLLQVDAHLPAEILPDLGSTVAHYAELVDAGKTDAATEQSKSFRAGVKNQLFDLLDALYGEKSALRFLSDFDVNNSPLKHLEQRASFIRSEHRFMPVRARGVNLLNNEPGDVPGIKQWFAAVLGLPAALELPVTNIFSEYSLRLLSDQEFYKNMNGLLNIDFVMDKPDGNFDKENIFDVPAKEVENPKDNYLEFRHKIYLLHHNIIFESFLRNGTDLSNYKILQPAGNDFILAYHAGEQEEWIALGKFEKHDEAIEAANQLQQFLIGLNLQSENIYLVEHLLLNTSAGDRCYTLQIYDADEQVQFSLFSPVSRREIEQLNETARDALTNPRLFEIRETGNNDFLILLETEDRNAIYCRQRFGSPEQAELFLENLKNEPFSIQRYYIQDEVLFPYDFMDFNLTAVLPDWSVRFHNQKFRAWCEELLEERRPAHLNINFLWLNASEIRQFEKLYFAWRAALENETGTKAKSLALARFVDHHLNKI